MLKPNEPRTVLLVEDDPIIASATLESLAQSGARTRVARSVGEAESLLDQDGPPAVLVTDISLAGARSGLDLAWTIFERWPSVRLLIVSGEQRPVRSQYPEAALFLTKPYPMQALVHLVHADDF